MKACDLCRATAVTAAYDLTRFCCAVRLMSKTLPIHREAYLQTFAKRHDVAELRKAVETEGEKPWT